MHTFCSTGRHAGRRREKEKERHTQRDGKQVDICVCVCARARIGGEGGALPAPTTSIA